MKKINSRSGSFLLLFAAALLFLGGSPKKTLAGEGNYRLKRPFARVPFMKKAPVIDGVIHPEEWQTLRVAGFIGNKNWHPMLEPRAGVFWLGCDGKKLFVAVKSAVHPNLGLIAKADKKDNSTEVVGDDGVEIWLATSEDINAKVAYQFIWNGNGSVFAGKTVNGTLDTKWKLQDMVTASTVQNGVWYTEMSVSLSSFGITHKSFAKPWGIRVCRNWKEPWSQARWGVGLEGFKKTDEMPRILWDKKAPVVQELSIRDTVNAQGLMKYRVLNLRDKSLTVKTQLFHNEIDQPTFGKNFDTVISARSTKVFVYKKPYSGGSSYSGISRCRITSADGKITYYERDIPWDGRTAAMIWTPIEKNAARFDMAYYPYYNRLRVRVKREVLTKINSLRSIELLVRKQGSKKELFSKMFQAPPKNQAFNADLILPELTQGKYELTLSFKDNTGKTDRQMTREFVRYYFIWEHNKLGISDKVIPPFTPLEVNENNVEAVLRTHYMNDVGLWSQVKSKGQNLLAAPINYQVVINGKKYTAKGSGLSFTKKTATKVKGTATWNAGGLSGTTDFTYDYDGMMWVTVKLIPDQKITLDRFILKIPMREPYYPLVHAVADIIRVQNAFSLPKGKQGLIWDSSKAQYNQLLDNFLPYIYLGGPERGICWFAVSDKEWVHSPKLAPVTIERQGNILYLNLNIIAKQTTLTAPKSISFGLQATPAKPRPKNWRQYGTERYFKRFTRISGTALTNGIANVAMWPYNRDFSIFAEFRRAMDTGYENKVFMDNLLRQFEPRKWVTRTNSYDHFKRLVGAGYRQAVAEGKNHTTPDSFTVYTNVTGALMCTPEWWTFQDEWTYGEEYRSLRNSKKDKRRGLILTMGKAFVSESRIDFLLWQYRQYMNNLVDGIYWDNVMLKGIIDPVLGSPYRKKGGRIQPSLNILELRELIKRTSVLAYQLGKQPANMAHTSTVNIVPILSFSNLILTGEFKYGDDDYQDRFDPGFTLAESTGRQAGNVAYFLNGIVVKNDQDHKKLNWLRRTLLGYALVHEMKMWGSYPKLFKSAYQFLYKFGYGEADCKVFNYWLPNPVVTFTNLNAKFLVLKKGNSLLVVVTDYGDGGTGEMQLALPAGDTDKFKTATNWETGKTLPVSDGKVKFSLKKHDFKIFTIRQ